MLTPDGHPDKPATLNNLGNSYQVRFEHLESLGDLEKSIDCHERTLILTPDDHPAKYVYLMNLGDRFGRRFKRLGTFQDANQAADYLRQAVQLTPDGHPLQASQLVALGNLHSKMFTRSRLLQHGLEAMHFHRSASLVKAGKPSIRLQASHMWAILSCAIDPCSLEGYTHCMTLLPEVVWLGTSVTQRYERLMRDIGDLVTKAAAAAISQRRYDLAVEWLEQGRSIVWGQILQLRTPYDDLYAVHPELAQQLQYVSHQLECAPMRDPGDLVPGQDSLSSHKIAWMHRELAQRREALLASARLLPGLEGFLLPLNASKLMGTGQDRVVVMFNICGERCDALVVQTATQDITHVPLTGFSTEKAEIARVELTGYLGARGSWRDDKQYDVQRRPVYPQHDPNWKDVLAMLWQDVVKPVLDHLGINQVVSVGNLPHITWCTTGSLSFLPLHAAGDYNSPDTILPNLAISSYTPTISSLCRQASSTGKFSGILAVGHGSPIRNLSSIPGTQAELDQVEMWAKPLPFVRLDEEQAYADTVLNEMGNHSWVHFACHASQNGMNPMKSAFHLHDKDLDLATIARTPLKNAQLAFLSACQTATGDTALPDESVHLAAGLLMAGYETVIATMWSINDGDAPLVAGKVYECLLEGGVPDSRKAAKALHKAVESLRDKIGVNEFARWVPYIHIGR
ncbi:hypothetical protein FS749_005180 [Ceratobasidium sp. UAMH 11750]|nr:hypothetical protein FS749_005180 [Ceratobasidium sp. UAMH 11750]